MRDTLRRVDMRRRVAVPDGLGIEAGDHVVFTLRDDGVVEFRKVAWRTP